MIKAVLFDWGGMRAVLLTGRPVPPADVTPDAELPGLVGLLELVEAW